MSDKRSLGRLNACVLDSLNEEQLAKLWSENSAHHQKLSNANAPIPFSDCWMWEGSLQNGYPSLSQGHARSKIKVHILAAYQLAARTPTSGEVVSHRCHRKKCINPEHLVIESISKNNARKGCLRALVDHSGNVWNLCWHLEHPCLRADTDILGEFTPHIVSHLPVAPPLTSVPLQSLLGKRQVDDSEEDS
jgi:hypothetical protein